MSKKWRSYLSLVVCVCCISCTLFLDTLKVNADTSSFSLSSSVKFTYSNTHTVTSVTGYISGVSGGGGYLYNGSGTITANSGGSGNISSTSSGHGTMISHVKMPFTIRKSLSDLGISDTSLDSFIKINTSVSSVSNTASGASRFTVSNIGVYDSEGKLLSAGSSSLSLPTDIVQLGKVVDSSNNVILNYIIEYDVEAEGSVLPNNTIGQLSVTTSFEGSLSVSVATTEEVNSNSTPVTDSKGHELQEESNAIQEDTKETTHSIFDSISDFFGSFFDNLIGVFVPEDGFFSDWFNNLNTLLSAKLGMLYAPFDLLVSTLQAVYSADTSESGIPFPGIKWEDTWLIEPFTFTFGSLGSSFNDLREYVYFATDTVLVISFLMLLQRKVKLILEGHEGD